MRPAFRVLSLLIVLLLVWAACPLAQAADYPWESAWASARAEQETRLRSAARDKTPPAQLISYYQQRLASGRSAIAHYLLGRVLGKTGKLDLAIRHMDQAVKLQPDFWPGWYSLAVLYLNKRDLPKARGFLDTAQRLKPEDDASQRLRLRFQVAAQEWDKLKAGAEALLRANSGDLEARYYLSLAYMGQKKFDKAKYLLEKLVQANPQAIDVRMLWVECCIALKLWPEAEKELRQLASALPKDLGIKEKLSEVLLNAGDRQGCIRVLREMAAARPEDPVVRLQLARVLIWEKDLAGGEKELEALEKLIAADPKLEGLRAIALRLKADVYLKSERPEKAVEALETLDGIEKLPPNLLVAWQDALALLGRHRERVPILERMLPFLEKQPEQKKKVEAMIAALRAGKAEPGGSPEMFGTAALADLIERCTSSDVEVRRDALYKYYERNLPFVDPVIYHRHDPRIEPDPQCRLWVVKILARFPAGKADDAIVRIAARYAGYALEDPDAQVRKAAANSLGEIRAPAGLIYLRSQLGVLKGRLADPPEGREDRMELEREYNAVRTALTVLTGHSDIPVGQENWITLDNAGKNLAAWDAWLDTAEGAAKRVEGIEDLGKIDDIDPRWQLRYILVDLWTKPRPAPTNVALAAYRVLRDRIQGLDKEKREGDPWWRTFPIFPEAKIAVPHLPEIRSAVQNWWKGRPRKRGGG